MGEKASDQQQQLLIVGRVRRAHGVRGEVIVEPMTEWRERIFAPGARLFPGTPQGDPQPEAEPLHVAEVRPHQDVLIVRFDEVGSRNEAEQWRDRHLLVPAAEVAPPTAEEVFVHDLIGLELVGMDGAGIGRIIGTMDPGGRLLLEVELSGGDTALVPYHLDFVRAVDLDARRVLVDLPEGIFD